MKITKFPQSNFLIEKDNTRILIDPGYLTFEKFKPADFDKLDAILVSHRHFDHIDYKAAKIWQAKGVPIFGNSDVVKILRDQSVEVREVKSSKEFEFGNFQIKPVDLPHSKLLFCTECNSTLGANVTPEKKCALHPNLEPEQVDGPPNTGFIIDDIFFHPGDGIEIENLNVENVGVPIAGPTVDFWRAWEFAESLRAKKIIPMHYSNPKYLANPVEFAEINKFGIEVKILDDGQSLEI